MSELHLPPIPIHVASPPHAPSSSNSTTTTPLLFTSISTNMPFPSGLGQLAVAVAQAKVNSALVERRRQRRVKARQKEIEPQLLKEVLLTEREERARQEKTMQARTPCFGQAQTDRPSNSIVDLLTSRSTKSLKSSRKSQQHLPQPADDDEKQQEDANELVGSGTDVDFSSDDDLPSPRQTGAEQDLESAREVQRIMATSGSTSNTSPTAKQPLGVTDQKEDSSEPTPVSPSYSTTSDSSRIAFALSSLRRRSSGGLPIDNNSTTAASSSAATTASVTPSISTDPHDSAAALNHRRLNSMVSAGVTTNIAQSLRSRARQKSLAVQAHAWGIHGSHTSKLSSGKKAAHGATGFLSEETKRRSKRMSGMMMGMGFNGFGIIDEGDPELSLASLLQQNSATARSRGQYQLSEEEKKITAYYSTIQSAACKVQESIDSLLPPEEDDLDALVAKWKKEGLSAEAIAIRMTKRAPKAAMNEHEAYRESFQQLQRLLEGLSASSLTSAGPASKSGAYNAQQLRNFDEEDEVQSALEREREAEEILAREAEEAKRIQEEKEREENEALDHAEAMANAQDGVGPLTIQQQLLQSPTHQTNDSSDTDSDDDELLARTIAKERERTGAAAAPAPTAANVSPMTGSTLLTPKGSKIIIPTSAQQAPTAASTSTFDPTSASALKLPTSTNNPAAVYRDLHNFFVGKRRNEAIDSKRLHMLENQQAQVEEGSEISRTIIHESMKAKDAHTARILQAYHSELKEISSKFGNKFMAQLEASIWGGGGGSSGTDDKDKNKKGGGGFDTTKRPQPTSATPLVEDADVQHQKLELLVAILQARVSEQDELLAAINVEDDDAANGSTTQLLARRGGHGASSAASVSSALSGSVRYTYAPPPATGGRSFESKVSRLLTILHQLDSTLLRKQDERFALQAQLEKLHERVARLLKFTDKAAMDAQEREEATRKEEELAAKHAQVIAEIQAATKAAEAQVQDLTKRNQAMTLTMKSIENELSGLHEQREHETTRMNLLRAKHVKECISIMRGIIPKHLKGLAASAPAMHHHHDSTDTTFSTDELRNLNQDASGSGDANDDTTSGDPGAFIDPESAPTQFAMKDPNVVDLPELEEDDYDDLLDAEAAAAAVAATTTEQQPPQPPATTAAEEVNQHAAIIAAAHEKELDARATTPMAKLKRSLEKIWTQVAQHEMAYIPWQEELYNTLQPTYKQLIDETTRLKARLESKLAAKRAWVEKQARLKAEAEADEEVRRSNEAAMKWHAVHPKEEEQDEEEEEEEEEGDIRNAASNPGGKIKPKQYARPNKQKSLLNDIHPVKSVVHHGSLHGEEPELSAARLKDLGHNSYIMDRITSFNSHKGDKSNQVYKNHIDLLHQDHIRLRTRTQALMEEWTTLHELDKSNQHVEQNIIQPTRKRIEVVKAHMERVSKAIADKIKFEEDKKAKARAQQEALDFMRRKLEKERLAMSAAATAAAEQKMDDEKKDNESKKEDETTPSLSLHPPKGSHSRRPSEVGFGSHITSPKVSSSRRPTIMSPNNARTAASGRPTTGTSKSQVKSPAARGGNSKTDTSPPTRSPKKLSVIAQHSSSSSSTTNEPIVMLVPPAVAALDEQQLIATNTALEAETAALMKELARLEKEAATAAGLSLSPKPTKKSSAASTAKSGLASPVRDRHHSVTSSSSITSPRTKSTSPSRTHQQQQKVDSTRVTPTIVKNSISLVKDSNVLIPTTTMDDPIRQAAPSVTPMTLMSEPSSSLTSSAGDDIVDPVSVLKSHPTLTDSYDDHPTHSSSSSQMNEVDIGDVRFPSSSTSTTSSSPSDTVATILNTVLTSPRTNKLQQKAQQQHQQHQNNDTS